MRSETIQRPDGSVQTVTTVALLDPASGRPIAPGSLGRAATIVNQLTGVSAAYGVFTAAACARMDIVNNTGVTIEYRRDGAGATMRIPDGSSRLIEGITNASQIGIRRTDQSATQVTVDAELFS